MYKGVPRPGRLHQILPIIVPEGYIHLLRVQARQDPITLRHLLSEVQVPLLQDHHRRLEGAAAREEIKYNRQSQNNNPIHYEKNYDSCHAMSWLYFKRSNIKL